MNHLLKRSAQLGLEENYRFDLTLESGSPISELGMPPRALEQSDSGAIK
jgi:hypothetical protein